jgi:hypothetical protein
MRAKQARVGRVSFACRGQKLKALAPEELA